LPLVAVGIILYYSVCGQSCAYLKGEIPGMKLTNIGLAFSALLFIAALLKWDTVHLLLLSAVLWARRLSG
jgi:hypothetical protein